jgi:hypothetical protein
MRALSVGLFIVPLVFSAASCSGQDGTGFTTDGDGGGVGGGGSGGSGGSGRGPSLGDSGIGLGNDATGGGDGTSSTSITVYAHTDTQLFTMDPMTNAVTLVGTFVGMGGGSYDSTVTDLAVNAEGDVFVNTETVVYQAAVPTTPGDVNLTMVATIAASSSVSFYALGFAPKGFLGAGETLVGGDSNGELWSVDTATGASLDLGSFGPVPDGSGHQFALSGDVFFYTDSTGEPTGLATIRSCPSSSKDGDCTEDNDYLAGVDMTAMSTAYSSGVRAASLLGGIYGGTSTSVGPGTGYGEIFGLAAWEGNVYGFSRASSSGKTPPYLLSIDTTTGRASVIPSTFPFTTGGWSGAGVTSNTVVKVPPPSPPPK